MPVGSESEKLPLPASVGCHRGRREERLALFVAGCGECGCCVKISMVYVVCAAAASVPARRPSLPPPEGGVKVRTGAGLHLVAALESGRCPGRCWR